MRYSHLRLAKRLREYDRELYVDVIKNVPCILRSTAHSFTYEYNGCSITHVSSSPYLVCPLTHNWKMDGQIVEWGSDVIRARLQAMDLWNNPNLADDLLKSYEKTEESKDRDRRNNMESFMYDFRGQFKKATEHVNVSSLSKRTDRRFKDDKKLKGV